MRVPLYRTLQPAALPWPRCSRSITGYHDAWIGMVRTRNPAVASITIAPAANGDADSIIMKILGYPDISGKIASHYDVKEPTVVLPGYAEVG